MRSALLLGTLALLLGGCIVSSEDKNDPEPPPLPHPRSTTETLFEYFARAQSDPDRDIAGYTECLHSNYTFTFTSQDAEEMREGDPTFPGFWTREEDIGAAGNMFGAAISISMEFTVVDSFPPESCDPGEPGGAQCRVYVVEVNLAVEVPDEPENTLFLVGGFADLSVTEDESDSDLRVIYNILDRTNEIGLLAPGPARKGGGGPRLKGCTENTSWGSVKDLFSLPGPAAPCLSRRTGVPSHNGVRLILPPAATGSP